MVVLVFGSGKVLAYESAESSEIESVRGSENVMEEGCVRLMIFLILSCKPFSCRRGVRCCIVPLIESRDFSIVLSIFPKESMWLLKVRY